MRGGLLAPEPLRNARRDVDPRVGVLCLAENIFHGLGAVGGRAGVRHREQARDSARSSRSAACEDILLLRLSGVAKVNVHIHKTRDGDKPRRVDDIFGGEVFTHRGDSAVFY